MKKWPCLKMSKLKKFKYVKYYPVVLNCYVWKALNLDKELSIKYRLQYFIRWHDHHKFYGSIVHIKNLPGFRNWKYWQNKYCLLDCTLISHFKSYT